MPTDREAEVLRHLALHRSRKQIALLLGISASTVETHILNICEAAHIQGTDLLALQKHAITAGVVAREEIQALLDDVPEPAPRPATRQDTVNEIIRLLKSL